MQVHEKKQSGYTIVEILIVFAIISLLASIVILSVLNRNAHARDAERISDLGSVEAALESYYSDNNEYPEIYTTYDTVLADTTNESVERNSYSDSNFLEPLWKQDYLKDKPNDPINDTADGNYYYSYGIKRATVNSGVYSNPQSFRLVALLEALESGENVYRYCESNVLYDYYYMLFSSHTYRLAITKEEQAGTNCAASTCGGPTFCPQW